MALIRCTSGSGGGSLTPTLLCTNSPTTAISQATDIPLSDDIDNYDYIKVVYVYSTTVTEVEYEAIYTADYILASDHNGGTRRPLPSFGISDASNNLFVRTFKGYASNKRKLRIGVCFQQGSTTNSSTLCIPHYIYGLK